MVFIENGEKVTEIMNPIARNIYIRKSQLVANIQVLLNEGYEEQIDMEIDTNDAEFPHFDSKIPHSGTGCIR